MKRKRNRFFQILCLLFVCAPADAAELALPRHAPYPGGVAVVKIGEADSHVLDVMFGDKRVLTLRQDDGLFALVGLALDPSPRTPHTW